LREHSWLKVARSTALAEQRGRCHYCFDRLHARNVTADHRKARSRGGSSLSSNIVAACQPCNFLKGAMGDKAFKNAIKAPGPGRGIEWHLAWSRRRINLAAMRARKRIIVYAGLSDDP
jgi:5-methylcytosine-specific restriction endonuclease McrA